MVKPNWAVEVARILNPRWAMEIEKKLQQDREHLRILLGPRCQAAAGYGTSRRVERVRTALRSPTLGRVPCRLSESLAVDGRLGDTELKNRRKCAILCRARRRPDRQLKLMVLPTGTDAHPRSDLRWRSVAWPDASDPRSQRQGSDCLVGLTFDEYAILDARGRFPKCAIRSSAHC
jgi:hypothetical protein